MFSYSNDLGLGSDLIMLSFSEGIYEDCTTKQEQNGENYFVEFEVALESLLIRLHLITPQPQTIHYILAVRVRGCCLKKI